MCCFLRVRSLYGLRCVLFHIIIAKALWGGDDYSVDIWGGLEAQRGKGLLSDPWLSLRVHSWDLSLVSPSMVTLEAQLHHPGCCLFQKHLYLAALTYYWWLLNLMYSRDLKWGSFLRRAHHCSRRFRNAGEVVVFHGLCRGGRGSRLLSVTWHSPCQGNDLGEWANRFKIYLLGWAS